MKVAVTGASGFLGRHLVEALRLRGHSVTEVPRGPGLLPALEAAEPRALYHCAAKYDPNPGFGDIAAELVQANVVYAQAVADAAAWCGVQDVFYCATPRQLGPVGLYGATKLAGEQMFRAYPQLRVHSVLIGDTFGPGDTRGKVIQKIIEASMAGAPPLQLPENKRINPICVRYVAEAMADFLNQPAKRTGNLCGPPQDLGTIQEYVRNLRKQLGIVFDAAQNVDISDPFPDGVPEYCKHYKSFFRDLRRYTEELEK